MNRAMTLSLILEENSTLLLNLASWNLFWSSVMSTEMPYERLCHALIWLGWLAASLLGVWGKPSPAPQLQLQGLIFNSILLFVCLSTVWSKFGQSQKEVWHAGTLAGNTQQQHCWSRVGIILELHSWKKTVLLQVWTCCRFDGLGIKTKY